jgi:hypothetical protein
MSTPRRFEFTLPPYFLNNARAIGSLEGLAKTADPSFNLLAEVYSFSIRTLLTSDSPGMRKTLMDITYDPDTGKPSLRKVRSGFPINPILFPLECRGVPRGYFSINQSIKTYQSIRPYVHPSIHPSILPPVPSSPSSSPCNRFGPSSRTRQCCRESRRGGSFLTPSNPRGDADSLGRC